MRLLLSFLKRYARPYAPYYALGLAALVLTNAIAVWIPHEIESAVNLLDLKGSDKSTIWVPVRNIIGFALLLLVVRTASRVLFFNPGRAIERNITNDIFSHYMSRPESWHQNQTTGDLISRATHDVLNVRAMIGYGFLQSANMILLVFLIVSQMVTMSPLLTLYALMPLTFGVLILRFSIRHLMKLVRESQIELSQVEQRVLEGFKGVRVVRDFGAQSLVVGNFSEGNLNLLKLREKIARIISFQLPLISVMGQVAIGVLLFWVAQTDEAEALNIGQIAAYIAYLAMLTSVLFQTGWMLNAIQRGLISLKRIDTVMPIEASFEESETKTFDPKDMGDPDLGIKVENLSLTLDEKVILEKIDLKVLPGQHIGILGTVGSGKSTLAAIITGQLKDFEGDVSLHGISVHELDVEAIGSAIRLVPDLPFLFTQQLNENVAFNQAKETIDHKGVNKALHVAAFDPQGENLVHGVETLVGEKGIALSGGQKQRITLARAIYAGGTVLILDDVLSAVDHQTEHKILERLEDWRLSQGKNVALINISNRVSALESADEVLVLDQGHIVERGRPEELAKGKGLYATTRNLQRAISDSQNEGSGT